jgi:hypothetical protein
VALIRKFGRTGRSPTFPPIAQSQVEHHWSPKTYPRRRWPVHTGKPIC